MMIIIIASDFRLSKICCHIMLSNPDLEIDERSINFSVNFSNTSAVWTDTSNHATISFQYHMTFLFHIVP